MSFWIILWKIVLIGTITVYGVMAVWVTFQGARDIKTLLALLKKNQGEADAESPGGEA